MWNITFLLTYLIVAFFLTFIITPFFIKFLYKYKLWKQIRKEALVWKATIFSKLHKDKCGTPTMWWAIILFIIFLLVALSIVALYFAPEIKNLFWINIKYSLFNRNETYLSLFTLFTVWLIWLIDDYMNVKEIWRTKWLWAKIKMIALIWFASLWAYWFYYKLWWWEVDSVWNFIRNLNNPFWKNISIWIYFIPLFIFVIISMANAVNITDWLDWLAWWLLLFNYAVYAIISYAHWLLILSALCMIIVWCLIAFLWFNIKPAQFYMWDVWALALWANLWIIAMMTNTLFVLIIISAIYILEILSSLIQVISKKLRNGKKIFLVAPFHHHLEALWWKEENIVMRFWLIWIILSVIWLIVSLLLK